MEAKQIYRRKSNEFSMRSRIRIIFNDGEDSFVEVIYPNCFGIENEKIVLSNLVIQKEYVKTKANPSFYNEGK